ncbi:MAG: zinc metallopeptidase [Paludibacteraceae bacterium]|nr:zinc metallopeptidase [Paludibacteraceae bacterium]
MNLYWIIFIGTLLASWIVSALFESRMKKYSAIRTSMTGREVAERMLRENGITDVKVICTAGRLTDHYNPTDQTVNLSKDVYEGATLAAMAVAAHECGHAVQHAVGYAPIRLRSALVPVVSFSSKWVMWVILAGMLLLNVFPQLMLFGIVLFAMTTLFSFVTLPVEINASVRAVNWMEESMLVSREDLPKASAALRAAAYTYVIAALSSLATLLYYIAIYLGGSRR